MVFVVLAVALTGCSEPLPADARKAIFDAFEPEEKPRIDSARQVGLLQEDLEMDAEGVWCVNLIFACWSCAHGEWRTCADSRLVRRIDDNWSYSRPLFHYRTLLKREGCERTKSTNSVRDDQTAFGKIVHYSAQGVMERDSHLPQGLFVSFVTLIRAFRGSTCSSLKKCPVAKLLKMSAV